MESLTPAPHGFPSITDSPAVQAATFLRNTIAASPEFGTRWEVVSIDTEPSEPDALWLHLSNGSTIRLDITVDTAP